MARTYTLAADHINTRFTERVAKGDADTYTIDFNAPADDDGAVSAVTWEAECGGAVISGEALAANIASALLSFPDAGKNRIKITATMGIRTVVLFITVIVEYSGCIDDYDMRCC